MRSAQRKELKDTFKRLARSCTYNSTRNGDKKQQSKENKARTKTADVAADASPVTHREMKDRSTKNTRRYTAAYGPVRQRERLRGRREPSGSLCRKSVASSVGLCFYSPPADVIRSSQRRI